MTLQELVAQDVQGVAKRRKCFPPDTAVVGYPMRWNGPFYWYQPNREDLLANDWEFASEPVVEEAPPKRYA